jgi:hypothetical protein
MTNPGYFTFFLCATKWPPPGDLTRWIDRLLEFVPSRKSAKVLASSTFATPIPAVNGPYLRNREALARSEPHLVIITTRMNRGIFEFFLILEYVRERITPDYLRYLEPETAFFTHDPESPRMASLSFDLQMFRAYPPDTRERIRSAVEETFVETNAFYAYGHPTRLPISGPYCLIRGGAEPPSPRIVDFDYRAHVEDVYELNWLSPGHVERITGKDRLNGLPDTPIRVPLDARHSPRGLHIDTGRSSNRSLAVIRECLDGLLRYETPTRSASLLIGRSQLAALGLPGIERLFAGSEVRRFPHDFVEVRGIHHAANRDPLRFERTLAAFYRQAYRLGEDARAREHMVEYAGLRNRHEVYYRIPKLGADDSQVVNLIVTDVVDPSELPATVVVRRGLGGSDVARVEEALHRWQNAIQDDRDVYGSFAWRVELHRSERNGTVCFEGVLDATGLRQEAINLLGLLLDEVNERTLVVPYLVLGH